MAQVVQAVEIDNEFTDENIHDNLIDYLIGKYFDQNFEPFIITYKTRRVGFRIYLDRYDTLSLSLRIYKNPDDFEQLTCKYPSFDFLIENFFLTIDEIKTMVDNLNRNEKVKKNVKINYDDIDCDKIPNEYKDPIMYTPIENPVAIPKYYDDDIVILDADVIQKHILLYSNNPFTLKPLTIPQINELNEREHIKHKINEFKNTIEQIENES